MIDKKAIFAIFLYGLAAVFFEKMPFRWKSANLAISWLFAAALFSIWSLLRNNWNLFSYKFALHILISSFLLLFLIYLSSEKEDKP